MKRSSRAVWNGTGKEGSGHLSSQSNILNKTPYSWATRFADGTGTNPEELMAAAHAGCFSMKLSFVLVEAGFKADHIETNCEVTIDNGAITGSHLSVKAKIPGISKEAFEKSVETAKTTCPVSKAFNTAITLDSTLE